MCGWVAEVGSGGCRGRGSWSVSSWYSLRCYDSAMMPREDAAVLSQLFLTVPLDLGEFLALALESWRTCGATTAVERRCFECIFTSCCNPTLFRLAVRVVRMTLAAGILPVLSQGAMRNLLLKYLI